jgi:preprotein translocase subunit SecY
MQKINNLISRTKKFPKKLTGLPRKKGFNRQFLRKSCVTLSILTFIRLGTFIPVPGIDHLYVANYIQNSPIANFVNTFSGGGIFVIGLFTLNIFPYINASILMQVLVSALPNLEKLQKEEGASGKQKITQLTRLICLGWAIIQSTTIALFLKTILFDWNYFLATEIIISLTTGAMIVLWLSEIITESGIGNGPSLLIFMNIVSNLPNLSRSLFEGQNNIWFLRTIVSVILFIAISGIIYLQEGTRIIPLLSAKELNKENKSNLSKNYIPLRLNQAGVMPIIFTATILVLPAYLVNLNIFSFSKFLFISKFSKVFYWIAYFSFILLFSSFYSTIVLNPQDMSNNLRKQAVTIPGIRPGKQTTYFLKQTMKRINYIGAFLLAILTTLPNVLGLVGNNSNIKGLGTTSLLIIIGVIIETLREIRSLLLTNRYDDMK